MSVFGYVNDNDDSLKSKQGGKFGLNTGFITTLEFNPNGGAGNEPADCVDIILQVGEKEFRSRVYDVTGELFKGKELVGPGHPAYADLHAAEMNQRLAVIIHAIKSLGVTDEQLQTALATPPADFKSWATIVTGLLPTDFATKPVDAFLEYQWTIKGENNRTFLQLPTNMKGGRFFSAHVKPTGKFTEDRTDGLVYKDDAGIEHPFTKSQNYMESNKAIQQFEEGSAPESTETPANSAPSADDGKW